MTIAATLAGLQVRHAAIDGVRSAPDYAPDTLPAGNCPAVLVDALEGVTEWKAHAGNVILTTRTYLVRLLVSPIGLGTPEQQRAATITILDALLASYRADPAVGSAAITIDRPNGVRDTGPRPFGQNPPVQFGGQDYYGAEIRLTIEERLD